MTQPASIMASIKEMMGNSHRQYKASMVADLKARQEGPDPIMTWHI